MGPWRGRVMLQGRVNAVVLKRSHGLLNFCRSSAIWRCLLSPFDAEPSIMMSFYGRTATASLS